MNLSIRTGQTLSLLTAVLAAMAVCWVAGCGSVDGGGGRGAHLV